MGELPLGPPGLENWGAENPGAFVALAAGRRRPDQIRGGRHGLSRAQVAASQRYRIEWAMAELAGSRGYHLVEVGAVVRRAGVSRSAFYKLYSHKDEAFIAGYARAIDWLLEAVRHRTPPPGDLDAKLAALLATLAANRWIARLCFVEVFSAGPSILLRRTEALAGLADVLFGFEPADVGDRQRIARLGAIGGLCEVLHQEIVAGRATELARLGDGALQAILVLAVAGAA